MKSILEHLRQEALEYIDHSIGNMDIRSKQILFVNCSMLYDKTYLDYMLAKETDSKMFYHDIIRFGYPIFVSKLYDAEFENLIGIALPKMDGERIRYCRSLLYAFKTVGWMEFFLINEKLGNFRISNYFNSCHIRFAKKYHWNEYIEKEYIEYFSGMVAEALEKSEGYRHLEEKRQAIIEKMKPLVFPFLDAFIGYDSSYEIEEYFRDLALMDAQQDTEWDFFDAESPFGGIAYEDYIDTIIGFAGYAIKHVYYCRLLQEKEPRILEENLMYNCIEYEKTINLIMENRQLSQDRAEKVFYRMALDPNTVATYRTHNLPPAPFIKVSKTHYYRSIAGSLHQPFGFFLENLHRCFPKDWDRNVNSRESIFKRQLYEFFEDFICLQTNIQISANGKTITDIDATIIDKETGEIGLFQLKWQDLTEYSYKSLSSKSKNYTSNSTQWVNSVKTWISTATQNELSSKFGIKGHYIDKEKIYIFVLGRRHGNYSANQYTDDGCAWAQWYQLLSCMIFLDKSNLRISSLHQLIRKTSPYKRRIMERKIRYKIGKYRIVFGGH